MPVEGASGEVKDDGGSLDEGLRTISASVGAGMGGKLVERVRVSVSPATSTPSTHPYAVPGDSIKVPGATIVLRIKSDLKRGLAFELKGQIKLVLKVVYPSAVVVYPVPGRESEMHILFQEVPELMDVKASEIPLHSADVVIETAQAWSELPPVDVPVVYSMESWRADAAIKVREEDLMVHIAKLSDMPPPGRAVAEILKSAEETLTEAKAAFIFDDTVNLLKQVVKNFDIFTALCDICPCHLPDGVRTTLAGKELPRSAAKMHQKFMAVVESFSSVHIRTPFHRIDASLNIAPGAIIPDELPGVGETFDIFDAPQNPLENLKNLIRKEFMAARRK